MCAKIVHFFFIAGIDFCVKSLYTGQNHFIEVIFMHKSNFTFANFYFSYYFSSNGSVCRVKPEGAK